jgi:polysaccharide biosynthesis transport protein
VDLHRAFDLFARRSPLVGIAVAAALLAAFGAWRIVPASYTAVALLHIPTSPAGTDWRQYDLDFADRLMNTYANLAASQRVAIEVARRVDLGGDPPQLALELVANTELMRAVARGPTPGSAAAAANALTAVLIELGRELGAGVAAEGGPPAPQVVEPAVAPEAPRGPSLPLLLVLAGIAGLGVGALLALVAENLDRRVFDVERIAHLSGLPVLAAVPRYSADSKSRLAAGATSAGRAYRLVRTHLIAAHGGTAPRSVLVVGAERGDGASSTVANLARAFADAGRFVVVVDCDLEPNQQELLGRTSMARTPKGTPRSTLAGRPMTATAIDGVRLVRAQPRVVEQIKSELGQYAATLLLDARPLADAGDALLLTQAADATILVVRRGRITVDALVAAREELRSVHARVVGVVVTHAKPNRARAMPYAEADPQTDDAPRSRLEEPVANTGTEVERA